MHPGIFIRGLPYEDNRTGGPKGIQPALYSFFFFRIISFAFDFLLIIV